MCRTRLAAATPAANPTGMDLDLPVDPNEPTYCFCNQVSYGEMVACDNPNVSYQHFMTLDLFPNIGCVQLLLMTSFWPLDSAR